MFSRLDIFLLFTTAVLSVFVSADTLLVPQEIPNIQTALYLAEEGNTVLVSPGTYYENIQWPATNGIKLLSVDGPCYTIIDGLEAGSVIRIVESCIDTSTVISGFTIRNGLADIPVPTMFQGGGICCIEASPTISGNMVTNNTAQVGGGIYYYSTAPSDLIIDNNSIHGNTAGEVGGSWYPHGGGVYISAYDSCSIQLTGNSISYNTLDSDYWGSNGGGVCLYVEGEVNAVLESNDVTCNYSPERGALYVYGPAQITQCTVSDNEGIGIFLYDTGQTVTGCQIVNNDEHGIIHAYWHDRSTSSSDTTYVLNCTIADNGMDGIAYSLDFPHSYPDRLQVHNCNILDNAGYGVASYVGGSVHAENNWWGDPSGPGGEGSGTGDEVSVNVFYEPWLTEMGTEGSLPSTDPGLVLVPNPFYVSSTVYFETSSTGPVVLQVYDISGRMIQTLVADELQKGTQAITISSDGYRPGVYLIRLQSGSVIQTERFVLLR